MQQFRMRSEIKAVVFPPDLKKNVSNHPPLRTSATAQTRPAALTRFYYGSPAKTYSGSFLVTAAHRTTSYCCCCCCCCCRRPTSEGRSGSGDDDERAEYSAANGRSTRRRHSRDVRRFSVECVLCGSGVLLPIRRSRLRPCSRRERVLTVRQALPRTVRVQRTERTLKYSHNTRRHRKTEFLLITNVTVGGRRLPGPAASPPRGLGLCSTVS
jgi:hypothetical protein